MLFTILPSFWEIACFDFLFFNDFSIISTKAEPTTMPSQPLLAITAASFGPLIPKPTATGISVFFLIFLIAFFTIFGFAYFAPVIPFMDT